MSTRIVNYALGRFRRSRSNAQTAEGALSAQSFHSFESSQCVHHPSDVREVYESAWVLHHLLPWELVRRVLNAAEYWTINSVSESYGRNSAERIVERSTPKIIAKISVLSRDLGSPSRKPVKKVVFRIESHDQGFCSQPDKGTWTWFDVRIRSQEGSEDDPFIVERLATNAQGSLKWQTHKLEWSEAEHPQLLERLTNGCCLEVLGMARFPGWTNFVSQVKVDLYVTALR